MAEVYLDRGLQFQQDWLGYENFPSFLAQVTNLRFEQLYLLPRSASSNLEKTVYDGIEVYISLVRHIVVLDPSPALLNC